MARDKFEPAGTVKAPASKLPVMFIPAEGGPPVLESPHELSASVLVEDDGIDSESSGEWHLPGIAELNELEDQRAVERTKLASMKKGIKRKAEEDGHDLQDNFARRLHCKHPIRQDDPENLL